ncbi:MAG: glycosyltransferase [Acidimicrobiales bacterium]
MSAKEGVLFISCVPTVGDSGPVATWITCASWAAAARSIWGEAWIITPEGLFLPEQAMTYASRPALKSRSGRWWRPYLPEIAVVAQKDATELTRALRFRHALRGFSPVDGIVKFIWQHHDLFNNTGREMARALGCPLVLFVDAPIVWEDRRLGVRRPLWGKLIEVVGESPQFRSADLVACVSDEVADEVCKRGASRDRVIVTPTGVDTHRFRPGVSGQRVRQETGLTGHFVVGWIGSFRPFHGLDLIVEATSRLQNVIPGLGLLLVGDGQERHRIQELARSAGLRPVCFTGTRPHSVVPEYVAAMDVAVVASDREDGFHYAPIKLREYMASARAVVAPGIGEVRRLLTHEENALLVPPADAAALARAIERLYRDELLRLELGRAARAKVLAISWEEQVRRVWRQLEGGADHGSER